MRFARQGVSKHHCLDEHDELHFPLARERRWHGSAGRTVTHRPDCRSANKAQDGVHGADEKMRLNSSVVLLDHQRSGDGKLVDGNEGAQRDRSHKRRSAYDPAK